MSIELVDKIRDNAYQAQGLYTDLALHTLGWKAFQDLCAQVCGDVIGTTVSIYREAQDGGQDAVFRLSKPNNENAEVATVQCKFSGNAQRRLKASDIDPELELVRALVVAGHSHTYFFMTNLGTDAPAAGAICDKLVATGVKVPYVLGREWITQAIRQSARLRALVPRVFGLGDLSTILDERCAEQTHALLGHALSSLRVYVPTEAHRRAVRILDEHKVVLLLGAPATGKSMLAAILATTAIDGSNHQCMKCEGPMELIERWNPNERGRLYWVDDAFGANQTRSDFIDSWIGALPKVKAAIDAGNRFILTSRNHIWNAAKVKLGTRNHPLFQNGKAVVNVGALSQDEREQILYNHVKAGNQESPWKMRAKPYMAELATNPLLLPEIARRLGDCNYTSSVSTFPTDLVKFVAEPAEFLKQTILELGEPQQAALTLVFLMRSRLLIEAVAGEEAKLVSDKFDVPVGAIAEALYQLDGTFLSMRNETGRMYWSFFHPTFADAISSILSVRPDLVDLYIRGTSIDTLLSETVCVGAGHIQDAVVVPLHATEHLLDRLLSVPDNAEQSRELFEFLARRASDSALIEVLRRDPELLKRKTTEYWHIGFSRRVELFARVHRLGLLDSVLRNDVAGDLIIAALTQFDLSFIEDHDVLALIPPAQLMHLTLQLLDMLDISVSDRITELTESFDPDDFVDSHFEEVRSYIEMLKVALRGYRQAEGQLKALEQELAQRTFEAESRKGKTEDDGDWFNATPPKVTSAPRGRSIFSDIDE